MGTEQADKPVDESEARKPFSVIHQHMQPRVSENDRAYAAFLLWCMMTGDARSKRLIAKSLKVAEGSVRYWMKKFAWTRRDVSTPNAEWEALRAYRLLMDLQGGSGDAAALHVAMDVILDRAGYSEVRHAVAAQRQGVSAGPEEHDVDPMEKDGSPESAVEKDESTVAAFKSPLSDSELEQLDPVAHLRELREATLRNHLRVEDVRRQVLLIDAVLGMIAKKVGDGSLQVKVSDIPSLLKARALITGLPTEQVAVAVNHQHDHTVTVESQRIQQARTKGGNALLAAMKEEISELDTIIGAVPMDTIDAEVIDG